MTYLKEQGYSEAEIQTMYMVSAPHNPTKMANPQMLSAYLRELLTLAGCGESHWKGIDALMEAEPDRDWMGQKSRDATAYTLRRDGCTVCCNVCGMDPNLVDVLMGHKLSRYCHDDWEAYHRRPDNWPVIAKQLERMVYHPNFSNHPAFSPLPLRCGDEIVRNDGQMAFRVLADPAEAAAVEVELTIETLERNDVLTILTPGRGAILRNEAMLLNTLTSQPIGEIFDRAFYQQCIQLAQQIDLHQFDDMTNFT